MVQRLIEQKVAPCLRGGQHRWVRVRLYGCQACHWHEGYECTECLRCVDHEQDWGLYMAILELLRGPVC